jgi:protein-L-isoaspartate(D-aspartate) O-methyltransferase
MRSLEAHRSFFASLVTASAGIPEGNLSAAFAATPRERFVGDGPWRVFTALGYIKTPSDDPTFLYQDITVALTSDGPINNGQPSLHAICLAALNLKQGETAIHIGAGTGYYTALLASLTGPTGRVYAYEVEQDLAERAKKNLEDLSSVTVYHRSGSEGPLPDCDAIYINAGATAPLGVWLDALRPGGRVLFPLTPAEGFGGMLLVGRTPSDRFDARFVCRAMFVPCVGARDDDTASKLSAAFRGDYFRNVQSLRRKTSPDETCWCSGEDWWLSTAKDT